MFKRLGYVLMIVAILAASGTHWAVLQSVAWTSMLADHLRTEPFTQALQKTLDGKHPCSLCKQIDQGKQQEKKPELQVELKKLEFSWSSAAFVFNAPTFFWETLASRNQAAALAQAPPVPPPKILPG